jgi:ABC-type Fe3+ transport system permease subunit
VNWALLLNSLFVAGAVSLLAVGLGFAVAAVTAMLPDGKRPWLIGACLATIALPPFLVVNAWIDLFGDAGSLRAWLPFKVYSFTGCIVMLTALFWPIAALLIHAAWRQANPELWEADPKLRGAAFLRQLLWPQARTAVAQGAGLVFVLALNQFSVPAILQVRVYPEELWLRFMTTFNHREALMLSWPMVVFPLLLVGWLARHPISWPRGLREWKATEFRRQLGGGWRKGLGAVSGLALAFSLGLPLGQLLLAPSTWHQLPTAWAANTVTAMQSMLVAGVPAVLTVGGGWALSRTRLGAVFWPVYFLPGVLLGIALIFIANQRAIAWVYHSVAILFLALGIRYLAPAWYGARLIRHGLDRDLVDTGRLSGATGWRRWRWVDWPQARPQLLALAYVLYLLCLWDVETINLIVPAGGQTLALHIFNLLHYGHNAEVNALCLLLLVIAVAPLAIGGLLTQLTKRLTAGGLGR